MTLSSNVNDLAARIATEFNTLRAAGGAVPVTISDTAPTDNSYFWYNSVNGVLYIKYDGFWVDVTPTIEGPTGPQGAPGRFTASETPPTSPTNGDAWLCIAATGDMSGRPFVWYDNYWVEMTPGPIGPQGATGLTGDPGIAFQISAPSNTQMLWVDTDDAADLLEIREQNPHPFLFGF